MRKLLIIGAAALALAGCTGTGTVEGDRALTGAGLGAATGAVIGGIATGRVGGAAAGAVLGGATGAIIGAGTTPRCQAVDRRGRPLYDQNGDPVTVAC
jgi:hypothetical protein